MSGCADRRRDLLARPGPRLLRVIDAFHQRLEDGSAAASALRGAKLDALKSGASPTVWAALTLTGDPRTTPRLD